LCTAPPLTATYTLSLHDALPISRVRRVPTAAAARAETRRRRALAERNRPEHPQRRTRPPARGRLHAGRRLRVVGVRRTLGSLARSEEHTSELQSRENLVCRLLLE